MSDRRTRHSFLAIFRVRQEPPGLGIPMTVSISGQPGSEQRISVTETTSPASRPRRSRVHRLMRRAHSALGPVRVRLDLPNGPWPIGMSGIIRTEGFTRSGFGAGFFKIGDASRRGFG